jgi:AraC-like DNA-binding protein
MLDDKANPMLDYSASAKTGGIAAAPWDEDPNRFSSCVHERIRCDSILVAIVNAQQPKPDEILTCIGLSPDALTRWINFGHKEDQLLKGAMRNGAASGSAVQGGWPAEFLPGGTSFAYQMLPDSMAQRRWWMAVTGRRGDTFDNDEIQTLGLLLRQWKSHFNRPKESDMARLLIGHDDRLIHTDPHGEQLLLDVGLTVNEIMTELRSAVDQRWPKLPEREIHDVALQLAKMGWWVRFRRQRAAGDNSAVYWYLEVRPLQDEELVTVGVVPDDRIGLALGYIHDHFNSAPSLNEISAAVHISPFHFHRLFSKQVGVTPKQYVLQKQIQVARWLLRTKRMPISQIADETGFTSHGHFTSTFRRFVGISPSQYRQGKLV